MVLVENSIFTNGKPTPAFTKGNYPVFNLNKEKITISQVKSGKFFLLVAIMFFIQVMFGALLAHYYTEPTSFYESNGFMTFCLLVLQKVIISN